MRKTWNVFTASEHNVSSKSESINEKLRKMRREALVRHLSTLNTLNTHNALNKVLPLEE